MEACHIGVIVVARIPDDLSGGVNPLTLAVPVFHGGNEGAGLMGGAGGIGGAEGPVEEGL